MINFTSPFRCKRKFSMLYVNVIIFLAFMGSINFSFGQSVYTEDFGSSSSVTLPYTYGTNATGSASKNANFTTPSWNQTLATANFGGSSGGAMSATMTATLSNTITCTFNVNSGFKLTPASISYNYRISGTGPTTLNISISGTGGSTSVSAITTSRSGAFVGVATTSFISTSQNLTGAITLTFTFTGGSSGGTVRMDDITLNGAVAALTPTLNAVTLGSALSNIYGTASTGVGFTAAGSNLSSTITATPQAGFEVSTTSTTAGFQSTAKTGIANNTVVYVRNAATKTVATSNNATSVVLSSTGATSVNVTTSASGNTVAPRGLTITASPQGKVYGSVASLGTSVFTTSGLVNSDAVNTVTLTSIAGSPATATVAGSPYSIVPSAASGTGLSNYTITYANGSLAVTPKALTITASAQSKLYGDVASLGTSSFTTSALSNNDAVSSVTLTSLTGSPATAIVAGSPYNIVPSSATGTGLGNYTITYANGALSVTAASLTITANDLNKCAGQTLNFTGTEFTTTSLKNSETVGNVTLNSVGAASVVAAGIYAITPSEATGGTFSASNYSITYLDGSLTVTAATALTAPAAPANQTVLVNDPSPANLTVTATGTALTYQWFSNGSNSNAGGTTVGAANGGQTNSFTPPTNILGTKYYYVVVTGTCGTVTSSAVAVTITNTNTWKAGNATTNWSLAANWTGNAVPTGANDAAIPVGNTPYPALTASVSVNNLVIDPTATVSLNGFTLTINGAVTGTGTLSGSATSNLITNASTGLLFTPGANTLKDLTVSAGTTTLSNALNITGGTAANTYGTVTVAPGATLASGGNLTIKSNQFGTARVAAGDVAGNYITGDVTVERYIPQNSKRAWRLLSVPTKGTKTIKQTWQENQAAGANGTPGFGTIITSNIATAAPLQAAGFDAYSQLPSMQSYNSATQGWVYVTSTNAAPIQSNKGYFLYIRGDRSVSTSSSTDAASATTLRTTGTLYQGNSNPSVSIAAGKFEPVGNTFASAIDFTSLSKTGGISNTFYVWDSKLLSGTTLGAYQTFNGSIGYTPATPGGSYPAGVPNTSIESGEAFMLGATGTAGTVTLVEASKTTGNQFTPFRPAALPAQFKTSLVKVNGSTTVLADNNIVVFDNAYKNAVDADDALKIQKAGETMSIVTDGKALIIDARQPVSSTDVISFNVSNLQPQAYKLSFSTQNMNTAGLTAFVEDKYLQTSTAINLDGVSDYGFTAEAGNAASSAPNRFSVVFKKAGATALIESKAGFAVSPNPVEGGVVNVQFKNQLAGRYSIHLLDAAGAVIFSTLVKYLGGSSTQMVSLPSGISRGAYQLEIISPTKVRELQALFINSIQ